MSEPLIPGGYILLGRKVLGSEIMTKPPLYLKVWIYLLSKAQHRDYRGLKRGQLITSIPQIQKAMSYRVGYRKEMPTYRQIRNVLDWLRNPHEGRTNVNSNVNMIVTTNVTHGMLITIVNYGLYQDPKNYERQHECHDEKLTKGARMSRQGHDNNKNDKNVKNDKEDLIYLTAEEGRFLETLAAIKNYPTDRARDYELYRTMAERYPELDLVAAIEQWATYKLDKPLAENANPRSQINTAFKKYLEWGKCLKERSVKSGAPERHPTGRDPAGKYRRFVKS